MPLLAKYTMLLRSSHGRLQIGTRQLSRLHAQLAATQNECERLQNQIALQQQLSQIDDIAGVAMNRQQLYTWLRRNAAMKHKTQELRLELRKQRELTDICKMQVDAQHCSCRQLETKCEKYEWLVNDERKKVRLKQLNVEESEIEERFSWSK